MLTQPSGGHILNTASLAGLMLDDPVHDDDVGGGRLLPRPARRGRRRRHQVTALCPGYVDSKLLDEVVDPTASVRQGQFRKTAKGFQGRLPSPETGAAKGIEGLEQRRAVVVVGWFAHAMHAATRFAPAAMNLGVRLEVAKQRRPARKARRD